MSPMVRHRHAEVRRHLDGAVHRAVAGAAIAGVALVLGAAWLLAGAGGWRPGSRGPLLLDLAALAAVVGAVAWGRRVRRQRLSESRIARSMEAAAGLADGELRGALELARSVPPGVSPALVARGQRTLAGRLDGGAASLAGAEGRRVRSEARRALVAATGAVVGVTLLGLLAPARALPAWRGLASPISVLRGPELPPLTVTPGTVELPRGSTLEVGVQAPLRDEVTLVWQAAGDVVRRERLPVREGSAAAMLGRVTAEITYHVEASDGARSPTYTALPVDPLFVTDVGIRLVFPPHTQRVEEEYRGEVPALAVPVGTRFMIEGRGNRLLGSAELVSSGEGDPVDARFEVSGSDFQGEWAPARSGVRRWRFVDRDGAEAEVVPPPLEVEVVPDAPPQVAVVQPAPDTVLPLSLVQPLVLQAADDHGVAWLELVARRVTALGDARPPVTQRIDAGDSPRVLVRPVMDVSSWDLVPGDEVRWFVRVRDNSPAGQEARTEEYVLRMPDAETLQREAGRELDAAARMLEELQEQAREAGEAAREAGREARAPDRSGAGAAGRTPADPGDVDFSRREELRRALEDQEARARQVDSLGRALSDLGASLSEAGAQDAELRSDLDELRSLLDDLGGADLQEQLRQTLARMDDLDGAEARRALEDLTRREEDFEARLDEAVERMRRAAARQEFATTTREAEDLARRQEALAASLEEEPSGERAARQDELAREAGELEASMGDLAARLEELGESEAARGVEQAREGAAEARAGMEETARQARDGEGRQAAASGQEAAAQMDEAAREMMAAREEMMRERAEGLQRALRQTTQDALALARRQGELRRDMLTGDARVLADLRSAVAAVERGAANTARNLALAARAARAGGGEREISASLGAALEELERTVTALDNPSAPGVPSPQVSADRAIDRLNEAARQALAAARSLSQGGQGQPTPEQAMEQLQELAQQQADINNQASQMMPMELTPESLEQQMQQLAQQQQQVASNVGQMSDQEGDGPLGDLQALAEEAEALARELDQGRLDATTRERQERLFHRLLDAGRSLEKEEESTERESAAPGVVESATVLPLDAEALGILRFRPDADALRRLSPAARALVVRYFQRLNGGGEEPARTGSGGGR